MHVKRLLSIASTIVLLLVPVSLYAVTLKLEAEGYTGSYDIAGDEIRAAYAPGLSGDFILVGLDSPDEFTTYPVSVSAFGYYQVYLLARGDLGINHKFRLVFYPEMFGEVQTVNVSFLGNGYGWHCWDARPGSGDLMLASPNYTLKMIYIDGGDVQIDMITIESISANERHSWGSIKRLYYH